MKQQKDDKQTSEAWPFVAGLAIGFIVALFFVADGIGEMKEEHNAKYPP